MPARRKPSSSKSASQRPAAPTTAGDLSGSSNAKTNDSRPHLARGDSKQAPEQTNTPATKQVDAASGESASGESNSFDTAHQRVNAYPGLLVACAAALMLWIAILIILAIFG